jgi:hypothetical protein
MTPLALFLLRLLLAFKTSATARGLRHIQVSLRDFDVGSGSRNALSLVRLLTEVLGFLHHRPTTPAERPRPHTADGEVFARALGVNTPAP